MGRDGYIKLSFGSYIMTLEDYKTNWFGLNIKFNNDPAYYPPEYYKASN